MSVPSHMWAIRKQAAAPGLERIKIETPKIGSSDILVKVRAASICGTDMHIYEWDPWAQGRVHPPLTVGHEFCGNVVQVGSEAHNIQVGDYISGETHIVCGVCEFCRTGRGHLCPNTHIIGVDRDGAWAEYVAIPAVNAWKNPPDLPPYLATLKENFGNAVHTAFSVDTRSKSVLVTGCGPVGVMSIPVAKACGARQVIATDISEYRLDLAKTLGADVIINSADSNAAQKIVDATNGLGVDTWLEMSGAPAAIAQGFTALKSGGEVAMLGLPSKLMTFDLANWIIFKGAVVHGIEGRRLWETWFQAEGLLHSGAVNLEKIVTHTFPFASYQEALHVMESGKSGKVVLLFDEE